MSNCQAGLKSGLKITCRQAISTFVIKDLRLSECSSSPTNYRLAQTARTFGVRAFGV